MSELMGLLQELENRWKEKGSDDYTAMAPGLGAEEVVGTLEAQGLRAPGELIDWYSWHNGVVREKAGAGWVLLAPSGFQQFSLRESLEERESSSAQATRTASEMAQFLGDEVPEMLEPSYWWEPTWFPIARPAGPDVLVVDVAGMSDSVPVLTIMTDDMDDSRNPRAESLTEWVRLLLDVPDSYWSWQPSEDRTTGWVYDYPVLPVELRGRF